VTVTRRGTVIGAEAFLEAAHERYLRQTLIDGFGDSGQRKLAASRVLVAGAGGLGSAVAIYLATAGVGCLRIVDSDRVEVGNLNRQILHGEADIGKPKVESAREAIADLNSEVVVEPLVQTVDETNVQPLTEQCDLIVDAFDNLHGRFILNRAAIERGIPFIHGAVHGLEGRAMTVIPGRSACLRCLYREDVPARGATPVLGATAAVMGSIEATEAIKLIVGIGRPLENRLLVYDGLEMRFFETLVERRPDCPDCSRTGAD